MLDHMSGLRRVTLNRNPLLADRGATFLAEVIEADLWIKGKFYYIYFYKILKKFSGATGSIFLSYKKHRKLMKLLYILILHIRKKMNSFFF